MSEDIHLYIYSVQYYSTSISGSWNTGIPMGCDWSDMTRYQFYPGWWCNNHLEKWWSSSMGRMTSHIWNGKQKPCHVPNHQPVMDIPHVQPFRDPRPVDWTWLKWVVLLLETAELSSRSSQVQILAAKFSFQTHHFCFGFERREHNEEYLRKIRRTPLKRNHCTKNQQERFEWVKSSNSSFTH